MQYLKIILSVLSGLVELLNFFSKERIKESSENVKNKVKKAKASRVRALDVYDTSHKLYMQKDPNCRDCN